MSGAHQVSIDAKPYSIHIETNATAILVVDMQNDFGAKGGMFDRAGIDISPIRAVVPPIARVLAAARQHGLSIIYLKMGFQPDLSDAGPPGSPNYDRHMFFQVGQPVLTPDGTESRILIRDHWGTEILPELAPEKAELQLYKHRFSGFFDTDLDARLKQLGVEYLIVAGCTTSVCVESTIRDAMFRDYSCVLLADCCAEPIGGQLARSNHEASLLTIETVFGWVSHSDALIQALESRVMAEPSGFVAR